MSCNFRFSRTINIQHAGGTSNDIQRGILLHSDQRLSSYETTENKICFVNYLEEWNIHKKYIRHKNAEVEFSPQVLLETFLTPDKNLVSYELYRLRNACKFSCKVSVIFVRIYLEL